MDKPAFPQEKNWGSSNDNMMGMTLLDYFAGQALASCDIPPLDKITSKKIAKRCYQVAQDMMKERKQCQR